MADRVSQTPRIVQLAAQIEADIRARRLVPGDPYLGTTEIARMLGVSTVAANRALQLLVHRRLLSRRQRSGAVVADGIVAAQPAAVRCVHFLVHSNYLKTEGLLGDGVVIGMQSELSGADVQLNFLSPADEQESVHRLISAALRNPNPEGLVLVRTSLGVQRLVQASGLPAVIHGSPYPSVVGLPWIDRDHRHSARLLTEHLLGRGYRRLLYLSRDQLFPGDYPFLDAITATMTTAGLPPAALVLRNLPPDTEAIKAAVAELLPRGTPREGLGIIARTEILADGAVAAVRAARLRLGRDVTVTASQIYRAGNERPCRLPHVTNVLTPREIGMHLGRMLSRQASGLPLEPAHEVIPVEMVDPSSS